MNEKPKKINIIFLFIGIFFVFICIFISIFIFSIREKHVHDSAIINFSAGLKELAQKIIKELLYIHHIESLEIQLENNIRLFENNVTILLNGGEFLSGDDLDSIHIIPAVTEPEIIRQLIDILEMWNTLKTEIIYQSENHLDYMIEDIYWQNNILLDKIEKLVLLFEKYAEMREQLIFIFLTILLLFIFSASFILTILKIFQLKKASEYIKTIEQILPICCSCKRIRKKNSDPKKMDSWIQIENYIMSIKKTKLTHGICPECKKQLYPDV